MRAKIQQTKRQKLILHISLSETELNNYLLQTGKQPQNIFTILIYKKEGRTK